MMRGHCDEFKVAREYAHYFNSGDRLFCVDAPETVVLLDRLLVSKTNNCPTVSAGTVDGAEARAQ